jgi:putative addiction module component (TIGR02574 family)
MTKESQAVLKKALGLDAIERAELIDALFKSFDRSGDHQIDALWAAEAESRIDGHNAGKIRADAADAVLGRIGKR